MAIGDTGGTAAADVVDEWHDRRWKLTGLLVAMLWLVAVLSTLLAGERRSDLGLLHRTSPTGR